MLRLKTSVCLALLSVAAASAAQSDRHHWEARVDLNSASSSTNYASWVEGGIGKLRYDEDYQGLGLGRVLFGYEGRIASTLTAHVVADYVDDANSGLDFTEAYLEWRPIPQSANRHRLKVGAFFPDVSLENADRGWSSAYTISPSAINTWIGEEVRTIGAEWSLQRAIGARASGNELELVAAMFFGNDPAGALLAWRGWSIHDRQTRLNDHLPLASLPELADGGLFEAQAPFTAPFDETDDRAGFYFGGNWRLSRHALVTAMHYDNHADPVSLRDGQYGWATRFDHLGAQFTLPAEIGLMTQGIRGRTAMGPVLGPARAVEVDFESYFVMLTKRIEKHRVSLRYDAFDVLDRDQIPLDDNGESGDSRTLAYRYDHSARLFLNFEWLTIRTARPSRSYLGLPVAGKEEVLRMHLSIRLGSSRNES